MHIWGTQFHLLNGLHERNHKTLTFLRAGSINKYCISWFISLACLPPVTKRNPQVHFPFSSVTVQFTTVDTGWVCVCSLWPNGWQLEIRLKIGNVFLIWYFWYCVWWGGYFLMTSSFSFSARCFRFWSFLFSSAEISWRDRDQSVVLSVRTVGRPPSVYLYKLNMSAVRFIFCINSNCVC